MPLPVMGSSGQDGSRLTTTTSCQRATALWTPQDRNARRYASRVPKAEKQMKYRSTSGKYAAKKWVTLRVTEDEKMRRVLLKE